MTQQNGRDLYFVNLLRPENISNNLALSSPHYLCFIAWDSEDTPKDEISDFVTPLFMSGCVYFCLWGSGCKRMHDIIDEIHESIGSHDDSVIMTTWHDDEPIEDAIFFFLNSTCEDEKYESTTNSSLAIVIGSNNYTETVRGALKDPFTFTKTVLNGEPDA